MKKSELIKELALELDIPKTKAKLFLNSLTDIVTSKLSNGENVKIDGFGSFYTTLYNSHNIKTVNGSKMKLKPRLSPRFTPSQKLKNAVKQKEPETITEV